MLNWFQGLGAAQWPGDLSTPQPMWSEPSEWAQPRGTGMSAASQQLRQPYSFRFLQSLLPSVSPSWVKTKSWVLNSTLRPFFFFCTPYTDISTLFSTWCFLLTKSGHSELSLLKETSLVHRTQQNSCSLKSRSLQCVVWVKSVISTNATDMYMQRTCC